MHDKNLHRRFDMNEKYPDPDIPMEQAWDNMNELLDKTPINFNVNKTVGSSIKNYFIFAGSGLLITAMAVLIYMNKKSKHDDIMRKIYKTAAMPVKDSLFGGVVAFIDQQSCVEEIAVSKNAPTLKIKGAVYLQGTYGNDEALQLEAGALIIKKWKGNIYVAFDSNSNTSIAQIQSGSGSAEIEVGATTLHIRTGESVRFDGRTNHIEYTQTTDPNLSSYATRIFDFTDMPLKKATAYLEKSYGVSFVFQNTNLHRCRITTRFDNKSLEEIMDVMAYTLGFNYKMDVRNNIVYISGKGCE